MAYHPLSALAAALLCAATALAATGDLDGNGTVQPNDARLALRFAGGLTKSTGSDVTTGDVASATGNTTDGRLSIVDAARILRAANGLDSFEPVGSSAALLSTSENLTLTADTVRNYQLPAGFRLSGTLRTTGGQPADAASIMFALPGSPGGYISSADSTGHYATVVAAGTYNASTSDNYDVAGPNGTTLSVRATLPVTPSVTVTKDTTQDYTVPALPPTGTIAGSLPLGTSLVSSVTGDVVSGPYANSSSDGSAMGTTYTLPSLPGGVEPTFSVLDFTNPQASLQVTARPALTVTAGNTTTYNLTLPVLVPVTGTVTPPTGMGSPVSISFTSTATTGNLYRGSSILQSGHYTVSVPAGAYSVDMTSFGTGLVATYHTTMTVPAANGNITMPAIPAKVTFSGKVTGPTGQPVASAVVALFSTAPQDGYTFSASTQADATGAFSLSIPKGAYLAIAAPPPPGS